MSTEARRRVSGAEQARKDIGDALTRPPWLERNAGLPFSSLTPDEFEVFCYLLLLDEAAEGEEIFYYGKTGDAGRDIIRVHADGQVELVQCKHSQDRVGVDDLRRELGKLVVNVYTGKIPAPRPDVVSFYVSSDLTSKALDLVRQQMQWRRCAESVVRGSVGGPLEGGLRKLITSGAFPVCSDLGGGL